MSSIAYDRDRRLGTVEGKIRRVFRSSVAKRAEYFFCDWYQANKLLDQVERPAVIYLLPPSGTLNFGRRQVLDRPETLIIFACASQFDFDGEENDGAIEEMKRLAARFILAYNASGMFEPVEGEISYQVLYNQGDRNVTGVMLTLRIKEKEGILLCDGSLSRRRFHGYRDTEQENDEETEEETPSEEDSQGSGQAQDQEGTTSQEDAENLSEGSSESDRGTGGEDSTSDENFTNDNSNNDASSAEEDSDGDSGENSEEEG